MLNESKFEIREEKILQAAVALFIHYGVDKTTIAEIAEKAGISKGAVYLHFYSKDHLIDATFLHQTEALLHHLIERIKKDERPLSLFTLASHTMKAIWDFPFMRALAVSDQRVLGSQRDRMKQTQEGNQAIFFGVQFVEQFQQAGMIRADVDAKMLGYLMGAVRLGIFTLPNSLPNVDDDIFDRMPDAAAEMFERAFGVPDQSQKDIEKAEAAVHELLSYTQQLIKTLRQQVRDEMLTKGTHKHEDS